jgi:hypothetical protein
MSLPEKGPSELQELEEHALEHLEDREPLEEEGFASVDVEEKEEFQMPAVRLGVVMAFPMLAAAVMVGGIFKGVAPRFWAAFAGLLGIGIALFARRTRNPILTNLTIVGGIFLAGVIVTLPAGSLQNIVDLAAFVRRSMVSGDALRPPVVFDLGWSAIVGWLFAGLGFASAWVAIELRRPSLGVLTSIPIVMIAAISVPGDAKIVSGLIAFALFATGLGLLSGVDVSGDSEQRSFGYELRRTARAFPIILGVTGGLAVLALNTDFLFPPPLYDPAQNAQKPKYIPITEVPDRVLFTVQSSVTGPWRMGGLDVYDGRDWRLPAFKDSAIAEVPRSGIVDTELNQGVKATFEIKDLSGAVLPALPDLVGIVAQGPILAYDQRGGNIRLAEGQIEPGLIYTVTAARIPTVEELQNVDAEPPREVRQFLEIPEPPSAVKALLAEAPKEPLWDRLDYLRNAFLDTVIADGQGRPVSMPPERVQDMLAGSKKGTPYEIVAAQAMLARWAGVPSRIGYGFDGGEQIEDRVEVRPKHGASFLEVYFVGYKWLPIIGTPRQATTNIGADQTQQDRNLLPSDDVSVRVFFPVSTDPERYLFEQIRFIVMVALPFVALMAIIYYAIPAIRKAYRRARRRTWAQQEGFKARIALAYSEFRDLATDFGYRYDSDTPLMFLDRVTPDDEHQELAWLVTRTLWGDLQHDVNIEDAVAAEELSRTLRKRLSQAHTATLRGIAIISRLSLRHPYAPLLNAPTRKELKVASKKAA